MRPLMLLLAVLSAALMALPVAAQTTEPELYEPCTNTDGRTVVTLDQPFSDQVETPIGLPFLMPGTIPAGTGKYVIDLQGLEVDERRDVNLTLTMLTAGVEETPASDYDLVVNGQNELSVDQPERFTVANAKHCQVVSIDLEVFTGTPADTLTLDVEISNFVF